MVVGRPRETSRSEIADIGQESRVTSLASGSLSFPQAAVGFVLDMPRLLATRRAEMEKTAAILKALLEQA